MTLYTLDRDITKPYQKKNKPKQNKTKEKGVSIFSRYFEPHDAVGFVPNKLQQERTHSKHLAEYLLFKEIFLTK